jgi:hypothetical protein
MPPKRASLVLLNPNKAITERYKKTARGAVKHLKGEP